ncbi:hypothetical protein NKJ46_18435 [Mesorhizobium sp. M0166]|uniref:hypothetical protein n=1 Tax=Mesorhizobium sp. M0166 TaxID=2956902 RepID=UPI00333550EA
MNNQLPPPPPGFEILPSQSAGSGSAFPPPPPGFEMAPATAVDPTTNQPPGVPAFDPGVTGYDPQSGEINRPGDKLGAFAGGAINGMPILGPGMTNLAAAIAAGLARPFADQSYNDIRNGMLSADEHVRAKNPRTAQAGGIAGGVLGTVPAVLAAPEAFGAGTASLLARMLAGGATGAAIGGADAGVRNGLAAVPEGLAWGGGLGAVMPGIGQLVGKGVGALAQRYGGPAISAAERMFGRAATADSALDMSPRLQALGDRAMPMDLGPNLQRQAGALAATPGEGQSIIRSAIAARDAAANSRIIQGLDRELGPARIPSQIAGEIKTNQQALGPAYDQAFQNARAVNVGPIADNLDTMATGLRGDAQRVVQRVRGMLNTTGTNTLDPNPRTLFEVRRAIDGLMESTTDGNAIRALTVTRQQINKELERAVPGIRQVDARFAELARQNDALLRGQQALDSGRTAPRPAELQAEINNGALPQGDTLGPSAVPLRLRQGARAEIDRIVGTNANDRVALQRLVKGEGDWNRDRLASLFGQGRAARILAILDSERQFADTSGIVTRNSETAARAAAMQDIAPQKGGPGIVRSALNLRFGDTAADTVDKIIGGSRSASQRASNTELAKILTSNDPASVTRRVWIVQAAQRRGDISAQRARELIQAMSVEAAMQRQALPVR